MTITCDVCNHQGVFRLYRIPVLSKNIYICDECETMYTNREDINSKDPSIGEGYPDWIKSQGLSYMETELVPVGSWWLIWFSRDEEKYVDRVELKRLSLDTVRQLFALHNEAPNIIHGVYVLPPAQLNLLDPYTNMQFDFDRYVYFVEFEDEYNGQISAESQNYIKDFDRQIKRVFGETSSQKK